MSPAHMYLWWLVFFVFTKAALHVLAGHFGDKYPVLALMQ